MQVSHPRATDSPAQLEAETSISSARWLPNLKPGDDVLHSRDSSNHAAPGPQAFLSGQDPLPLLSMDTNWKFKEMIKFRDETIKVRAGSIVHKNPDGLAIGHQPFIARQQQSTPTS